MAEDTSSQETLKVATKAYEAFLALGDYTGSQRNEGIKAMAKAIRLNFDQILEANTLDLEMSRETAISEQMLKWLKLTPERLESTVEVLEQLVEASDPIQRVINATYQLNPSQTYCQRMPLGVIGLVYEGFPELAIVAAGFALKSGNSLILRGGSASSHSDTIIAQILQVATEDAGLPLGCVNTLISEGETSLESLLTQEYYVNLILPYGRPSLIAQVSQLASIPVLRAAMGNCYLYWSPSGDLELARHMIIDSHASIPDPVNAIEKVLISPHHNSSTLLRLLNSLQEKGFKLRGDRILAKEFPEYLTIAKDHEWNRPYLDKIVTFKVEESLSSAIYWINQYSSGHADCIVTESYRESRQFALEIDSALLYINSSPRFSRNPKQGESLFLGISNQKGQRRGLINLETFTTVKQVVQG
ncbi:MAG: Gamma-glutamyl phosphate reductase [Chroococcopsis gigantea SAG 12.99]|jgi:glutamate-5-semialdehyde dehydrogenase|nr:glutamate-5-semialdehyde dehydrogenase [Chlorogloea purpurea SAG 13.99]MDV3000456.1 Gamma-glutamyl phosphate reductase [Chroococcopsis gigantea SAG 12.99]